MYQRANGSALGAKFLMKLRTALSNTPGDVHVTCWLATLVDRCSNGRLEHPAPRRHTHNGAPSMFDTSATVLSILKDATPILLGLLSAVTGFLVGQRTRSVTIATTLERDWLNGIAVDLAEFIEVQYDVVWKRWRLQHLEISEPKDQPIRLRTKSLRYLQDACWEKTFRSDFLKTKLLLLLDEKDKTQGRLIEQIGKYASYADKQNEARDIRDPKVLYETAERIGIELRENVKASIVTAGRQVLDAKRRSIRKSA